MQQESQNTPHDGLLILSEALARARAEENGESGSTHAMGYCCVPDAEQTPDGAWRAVLRAQGRGETITVVGRSFATPQEAIDHASTVSLVDLFNGGTA